MPPALSSAHPPPPGPQHQLSHGPPPPPPGAQYPPMHAPHHAYGQGSPLPLAHPPAPNHHGMPPPPGPVQNGSRANGTPRNVSGPQAPPGAQPPQQLTPRAREREVVAAHQQREQQQQQQQAQAAEAQAVAAASGPPNSVRAGSVHPGPHPGDVQLMTSVQKLAYANEQTWISIASAAESMDDHDRAISAYEAALRHNPYSVPTLNAIASLHRSLDRFSKAIDYFQRVLNIQPENGETWGAMGHCFLMQDELQKAYTAYQQALYHLPNPKEPKLWYGIGILYDRYGSLEHAEEAFASVVRMDPNYEKANEIYFRLGIIYKQQNNFTSSLDCFRYILSAPPRPLTEVDIWFQIGHVYEQQKNFALAKEAYERVLAENPSHAKVLQQLGWLYHQSNAGFQNQERAIQFLTKSLESDPNDSQSWYLLGRAYMAGQNYNKAYEAYQQAVYRDGKNPTFWCSIGVLYYQINQFRDALDAYSRAIRLNPYISEVWFDLGSLYESCNNQTSDAIDAYARAAELDPDNENIRERLMLLRNAEARGEQVSSAPAPQDVHPTAYANSGGAPGPPSQLGGGPAPGQYAPGPAGGPPLPPGGGAPILPGEPLSARELPGPALRSPGQERDAPHRGPPPAIPNIDDRGIRGPSQTPFAPMEAPPMGGPGSARTSPSVSRAYAEPPPLGVSTRDSPRNQHHPAYPEHRHPDPYARSHESGDWSRSMGGPPPSLRSSRAPERGSPPRDGPSYGSNGGGNGPLPFDPLDRSRPLRRSDGSSTSETREASGVDATRLATAGVNSVPAKKVGNTGRKAGNGKEGGASPAPRARKAAAAIDSPRAQSPLPSRASSTFQSKPDGGARVGSAPGTPAKKSNVHDNHHSHTNVAPSREIDEDYDEGAADALLGLASAASASAAMPARSVASAPPKERASSPPAQSSTASTDKQPGSAPGSVRESTAPQPMEEDAAPAQPPPSSNPSLLGKRAAEQSESDGAKSKELGKTPPNASNDTSSGSGPTASNQDERQSKKPRHDDADTATAAPNGNGAELSGPTRSEPASESLTAPTAPAVEKESAQAPKVAETDSTREATSLPASSDLKGSNAASMREEGEVEEGEVKDTADNKPSTDAVKEGSAEGPAVNADSTSNAATAVNDTAAAATTPKAAENEADKAKA